MKKNILQTYVEDLFLAGRQKKKSSRLKMLEAQIGTTPEATFDADFYLAQLPDSAELPADPLTHYLENGFHNGLDPCEHFSTTAYLHGNPDVNYGGSSPWEHYILFGKNEGRRTVPSFLSKHYPVDLLDEQIYGSYLDTEFYLEQIPAGLNKKIIPWRHYLSIGWLRGLDPRSDFSTDRYLEIHSDVREVGLNPLRHFLEAGWRENRQTACSSFIRQSRIFREFDSDEDRELAARFQPYFERDFYLARNPDVKASGVDPLRHYVIYGYQEYRDPNSWFSTQKFFQQVPYAIRMHERGTPPLLYAIESGLLFETGRRMPNRGWSLDQSRFDVVDTMSHSDVSLNASAQALPVNYGAEPVEQSDDTGGIDAHPLGAKANVLATLLPLDDRAKDWADPETKDALDASQLNAALKDIFAQYSEVVVSVSHDLYTRNVGGLQVCIMKEAAIAKQRGVPYLHISPTKPLPMVAQTKKSEDLYLTITLDGNTIGICSAAVAVDFLSDVSKTTGLALVIHQFLGLTFEFVSKLTELSKPASRYFWIHDYFSICPSLNLLRNDLEYCAAPESTSTSCQLCIHGRMRREFENEFSTLFKEGNFQFIAPSPIAKQIWADKFKAFSDKVEVLHHCNLVPSKADLPSIEPSDKDPIRVAFIGYPRVAKGWFDFVRAMNACQADPELQFFHLCNEQSECTDLTWIPSSVSTDAPRAMIDALQEHKIDVVLQLSVWPETFCIAAYETVAAGALLVASKQSGNAALLAEESDGRLVGSPEEIIALLQDAEFRSALLNKRQKPKMHFDLEWSQMVFEFLDNDSAALPKLSSKN
jgi:hypothetical protein